MQNRVLSLTALLIGPLTVHAEQTLSPVIVTATRTAQTVDETLASVTVIDRETIERLQPKEFTDLLRGEAGVGITQNGPFGKNTSIYLRGTASEHTLLLIDGVRMGSATTGAPAWQFLSPREIERVEIVRGPRTSLYGSDAVGGVVQVFTHEGKGEPSWNVFAGGGSFGTHEFGAGVSGEAGRTGFAVSGSHFETDGIDVKDGGDDDKDGYRNTSTAARIRHEFANGLELSANAWRAQGTTEFDGFVERSDFVEQSTSAGIQGAVTENWWSQLTLSQSRDESDNFAAGGFFSRFDTRRDMAYWQNDIVLGRHLLTVGADYRQDRIDSTTDYGKTRRDNRGVYLQLQMDLGRHALSGSLRRDDNEAFGKHDTGQLAWGYQLANAWRARASYGTAFHAPTFNELYYPDEGWFKGNPDLKPEQSASYEFGLRYSAEGYYLDTALFETRIDNLIQGWPLPQPENIDEARIRGLELEGGYRHGVWRGKAALTWLDHEDLKTGNRLPDRPRVTGRVDVDRDFDALSIGFSVSAEGPRYGDPENEERLPGYALLDLRLAYRVAPEWEIRATAKNALDKDYQTVSGYNKPGSAAYVSVHYQP